MFNKPRPPVVWHAVRPYIKNRNVIKVKKRFIAQHPPIYVVELNYERFPDFYKAKYVKGMKIFMAFISKTAKRINTITPKIIALEGVVAEPTCRSIRRMFNNLCIAIASSNHLTE